MSEYSFNPRFEHGQKPDRAPRPKDAATLVLLRKHEGGHQVLMGKRNKSVIFMPNKFVFPGGRLSPSDSRITPVKGLRPEVEDKLRIETRRQNVQALALAAIRETFEETGLLVGERPSSGSGRGSRSPEWKPFYDNGVEPALDSLEFIARAITPPARSRRFDARFFMASADLICGEPSELSDASGELLKLKWFDLPEARALDLPDITHLVLKLIDERLTNPHHDPRPLFVRYVNEKMVGTRL